MAKAELRSGYTTGACAAAGVKAAFLFRAGEDWHEVELMALDGTPLTIPVKAVEETPDGIRAEVVKFSGHHKRRIRVHDANAARRSISH